MSDVMDTSVLVAAIVATEAFHVECQALLDRPAMALYSHGVAETFSTLTGGRKSFRMPATLAAAIIQEDYLPDLTVIELPVPDMLLAMREAESRGVRGGAIFDYLHLMAARCAGAERFYTLNVSNFLSFHREGDPEIVHP